MFSVPEGSEGREHWGRDRRQKREPWSLGGAGWGSGEDSQGRDLWRLGVTGRGAAGWSSEHEVGDHWKHRGISVLGKREGRVLGRFGQFSSQCTGISFLQQVATLVTIPVCSQLSAAEPGFTPGALHRQRWGPLF